MSLIAGVTGFEGGSFSFRYFLIRFGCFFRAVGHGGGGGGHPLGPRVGLEERTSPRVWRWGVLAGFFSGWGKWNKGKA